LCDCEVDDGGFDADFWNIMGVGHFCGEVKFEFVVIRNVTISQSENHLRSLFNDLLQQNWFQGWIEDFFDVF
jgi:hypothetical protein